jgi:hypothetical protein
MMIGLWSLVLLLGVSFAHAQPGSTGLRSPEGQPLEQLVATDPGAALALAQAWQQQGKAFPEALLRQAVTAALRQDAPWTASEAAIRAFELYKDRPWAADVMGPFIARQASNVVLNPEQFTALNRQWTTQVIARTASHTPSLLLSASPRLAAIDHHWAKALAEAVVSSTPDMAFSYAKELSTVDRAWAQGVLHKAAQALPYAAVRGVQSYLAEPWGPQLFAAAALRMPQWTMNMAASASAEGQAVQEALRQATEPSLRVLSQIAMSPYEREIKVRMAVFMHGIATGQRSLDEAARLSGDDRTYFRTLIAMKHAQPDSAIVEAALTDQALSLLDPINTQYDQPEAVRFRSVTSMTAQELYVLLTYTEMEIFTSSYRGLFARLLARMKQERLTGDQLLAQVASLRFLGFMKSAAAFNRLDQFLATIPSTATRRTLLTRLVPGMEQPTPAVMTQAMTAAEVLATPLDADSLRALRDMIISEYQRAEQAQNRHAMAIYGLLAAQWDRRAASDFRTPSMQAIATHYRVYLPDFKRLPVGQLFHEGRHVQRHFFYDDDDGKQSFTNFLAHYRHDRAWQIDNHNGYVQMTAQRDGRALDLYANTPTTEGGIGEVLPSILQQHRPEMIVHRGHSIYVDETIKRIPASARIVFLGNCGSYTQLADVLQRAPQAHLITTKGIGSLTINDPLLKALNTAILHGKDLVWAEFWAQMTSVLAGNPRFEDYVPPDKNISVHFLQAYRTITAEQRVAQSH